MKLFWSSRSPFVRFVMVVAHEKGLADAIETERVVVAAASPNADVMAHNPLNKLPTLILDDGAPLYDSRVIAEYLDTTGSGARLIPADGTARWTALCRTATGIGLLDLLVGWLAEYRKPEAERNAELHNALMLKFTTALDRLEADASDIAATPFGIAHAAIGSALAYADFRFPDIDWREGRPHLASLIQDITARPSFKTTGHADVY